MAAFEGCSDPASGTRACLRARASWWRERRPSRAHCYAILAHNVLVEFGYADRDCGRRKKPKDGSTRSHHLRAHDIFFARLGRRTPISDRRSRWRFLFRDFCDSPARKSMTDVPYEMEYQVVLQVQVSRCQTIVFDVSRTAHHQTRPRPPRFFPFLARDKEKKFTPQQEEARADARGTLRRTAHAESVRLPRQRSKVGSPSAVLFPPRPSRSPRSFRGLRRARVRDLFPSAASERRDRVRKDGGRPPDQPRQGAHFSLCVPDPRRRHPARPARDRWSPAPRSCPPEIRASFSASARAPSRRPRLLR